MGFSLCGGLRADIAAGIAADIAYEQRMGAGGAKPVETPQPATGFDSAF